MAKKSLIEKQKKKMKYKTRNYSRCLCCGRAGAYMRQFKMCRICFRQLASQGLLPGIKKSSW